MAQIWDVWILLELWSARGEFSRNVNGVRVAGLDSGSSFGDVISWATFGIGVMLVSLVSAT